MADRDPLLFILACRERGYRMDTLSYSAFRSHLANTLDRVNENHKPILIIRQKGKPAVVMSLEDFKSYEETAYLMASPKNTERINKAISQLESGEGATRGLIEE